MQHYVYKIIVTGTDLYYIGKHSTRKSPENDGYFGSGSKLRTYPIKTRAKIILETFESSKSAFEGEKRIIGDLWKTDPNCLNSKPGGKGAPSGEDHHWYGKPTAYTKRGSEHHLFGKKRAPDVVDKITKGLRARQASVYLRGENHPGFGKSRSAETKQKLSIKNKGRILGPFSDEHKQKISASLTGYKRSAEHQAKIDAALLGRRPGNTTPPPMRLCDHCQREIDVRNFGRYHGDKCSVFLAGQKLI